MSAHMIRGIALLNTAVLTDYGSYTYRVIDRPFASEIAEWAYKFGWLQSYIGHQATAEILEKVLGVPVAVNRGTYQQLVGDSAIVFKLRKRIDMPRELTVDEVEDIGFDLGLLRRVE